MKVNIPLFTEGTVAGKDTITLQNVSKNWVLLSDSKSDTTHTLIYGYKMKGYWNNISTVDSYYQTNMDFLKPEVRQYFFKEAPRIYSKVDDLPPAKYNEGSDVRNSLVASGSIINGKVENSILFKEAFIGKNCIIKNSIILNEVYIGDNTHIENCIVESRGTLKANTYYCGEDGVRIVSENNERYIL